MNASKLISCIFLVHFFLFNQAAIASSTDSLNLEFIEENGLATVELISLGGHQAYCVELKLQNRNSDTLHVWIEPARILQCEDERMQDIVILKSELITLAPGSFKSKKLYGFCCRSSLASPEAGVRFRPGLVDREHLANLSKFIDNGTYDSADIQSAVWVISNGHSIASICSKEETAGSKLKFWLSKTLNKPLPWYCIHYDLQDTSVFQNRHLRVTGNLAFRVIHYSTITIQVRSKEGRILEYIQNNASCNAGEYDFPVDINVQNWPKGNYEIVVFSDGNRINKPMLFSL